MDTLITRNILLDSGWKEYGNILVLRSTVRFGWYPATGKLIVGYTEVPFAVRYVSELQSFLDVFRTKQTIIWKNC